jgi:hypothetical protein
MARIRSSSFGLVTLGRVLYEEATVIIEIRSSIAAAWGDRTNRKAPPNHMAPKPLDPLLRCLCRAGKISAPEFFSSRRYIPLQKKKGQ